MRFVPSAKDHWFANDKGAHFGLWFALTCCLLKIGLSPFWAAHFAVHWGIAWEISDGWNLFLWNDPDGFSWKDLVADIVGIVGALLIWP